MDLRSPFSRHQQQILGQLQALGLCTDASLAAYLSSVGEEVAGNTIVHWRKGARAAPLGLLPLLLQHVDDPAAVLDLLARPLGLRVVPDADPPTDGRELVDRTLDLASTCGQVAREVHLAVADGVVDAGEAERIRAAAAELRRQAAELEAVAGARPVAPVVRARRSA